MSRFFFFQAEDGIRDKLVTGVQTCALPISTTRRPVRRHASSVASSAPALLAAYGEHGATGSVSTRRRKGASPRPYTSLVEITSSSGSARPSLLACVSPCTIRAVPPAFTAHA